MNSIYPELIAVDVQAETSEEAIRKVGQIFLDNGFVKDTTLMPLLQGKKYIQQDYNWRIWEWQCHTQIHHMYINPAFV